MKQPQNSGHCDKQPENSAHYDKQPQNSAHCDELQNSVTTYGINVATDKVGPFRLQLQILASERNYFRQLRAAGHYSNTVRMQTGAGHDVLGPHTTALDRHTETDTNILSDRQVWYSRV